MQSEAGAAGTVHGALQAGALATSFTSSQGLLLFIPDMYRIAGEFLPCCIHVSARALATHALSIFGDHQDVMACRQTGFALLSSASVQEAHDLAAVAHAATLESRVPFLHFMDGFRTSHELNTVEQLSDDDLGPSWTRSGCGRTALERSAPSIRCSGGARSIRTSTSKVASAAILSTTVCRRSWQERWVVSPPSPAAATGCSTTRGTREAERVLVIMGSGAEVAHETVEALAAAGEKVGVVKVRLFRPFSVADFVAALPPTTRAIAVLDRTKEPGSVGEPLYLEVVAALSQARQGGARDGAPGAGGLSRQAASGTPPGGAHRKGTGGGEPLVIGGRYGLGSKEFDPAMVKAVLDELGREAPRNRFTVGIKDDLTELSVGVDESFRVESRDTVRAVLYGLGADGTVGASKNTVKILGEEPGRYAQGYFVYDSKKSGSITVSHLRFGRQPIRSSYLVKQADFVACHQYRLLDKLDLLAIAKPGGILLLNTPYPPEEVWDSLSREVQQEILAKGLDLWIIDAFGVAEELDLGFRINIIMQTCFFAITKVMPVEQAISRIKESIEKTYGKKGGSIVKRNLEAVDRTFAGLHHLEVPDQGDVHPLSPQPGFGTERPEMRPGRHCAHDGLAWRRGAGERACRPTARGPWGPPSTRSATWLSRSPSGTRNSASSAASAASPARTPPSARNSASLRTWPEPRQGSGLWRRGGRNKRASDTSCRWRPRTAPAAACASPLVPARTARTPVIGPSIWSRITSTSRRSAENYRFFLSLPSPSAADLEAEGTSLDVKTSQFLQPLFEYCGACAGCGETQYLRLLSQLFGDRLLIANATGCSSIYTGNLPSTAYTANAEGRGPAWANSLFEDNAEFGLGLRLAVDKQEEVARRALEGLAPRLGERAGRRASDRPARVGTGDRGAARAGARAAPASSPRSPTRSPAASRPSPTSWCGGACGSWAATAGPTT